MNLKTHAESIGVKTRLAKIATKQISSSYREIAERNLFHSMPNVGKIFVTR